jgi:hypothetical protein
MAATEINLWPVEFWAAIATEYGPALSNIDKPLMLIPNLAISM